MDEQGKAVVAQNWVDIAHASYNAYGAVTDFKNYQGLPMPAWDDLPQAIRTAWGAAVRQVKRELEKENWGGLYEPDAAATATKAP